MNDATASATAAEKHKWLALTVLCLGVLVDVLDTTIVTVALPSIKSDLRFDDTSLAWVINAYMLTFGGFLLLGGRLGDLYGHRKWFLIGIAGFALTSLACGLAHSQEMLIVARAAQGIAGAVIAAVALSLIMDLFPEPVERAKAMGVYSFVASAGGSVGTMLGGVLVHTLNWHWIFFVNLPVGAAVIAFSLKLLPDTHNEKADPRLDVTGAITVTLGMLLAVYAVINGNSAGWTSVHTLGLLGAAAVLIAIFLVIESRVAHPLMPLGMFRLRNVSTANAIGVLWAAAMFAWFFLSALYMQQVLGYDPLQVGLAFLPANLIMAAFSLGLSAKVVLRFGIRWPIVAGLGLAALGLLLFARAPADGSFVVDVLPGMLLLGLGAGMAFNPVLLAAMSDVSPSDSGVASGLVNTSFMMGGALGLAVLASLAGAQTGRLLAENADKLTALNGGYHAAFFVGAIFAALAALLGAVFIRASMPTGEQPVGH
ncbi:MAG: DHA2 family efflux MFS transporter permease subunit [Rudaea sp.]|uniref:DHA2 family efflux MFS transporter permease subunit n=1 Tax=unclassified Rudaea TaxID=2627037 RepID=UPI0010F929E1|nr:MULTISPECIES: DHA2 family efflux MFS transporter permease subunit [unclassified Rudaea]MBN8888084.1 DHA2 family efflux MFS transporter permease subunit [Rudaea sp.]MBR0343702.1 DHA2 family efflux MFS transporter permease subunit [Rudaea sp.]